VPAAFNDNLIYMEFSRHSIIAMPVAKDGHLVTDMTKWTVVSPPNGANVIGLLPSALPTAPIDATVGPDGAIYILEYGGNFYNGGTSKLSRLKCSGCTDAISKARAARTPAQLRTGGPSGLPGWLIPVLAIGLLLVAPIVRRHRMVK
jgi:hypothetical protein